MNIKKSKLVNSELEYIRFVGECIPGWKDAELCPESIRKLLSCFGQPNTYPVEVVFGNHLEHGEDRDCLMSVFGIEKQRVLAYIEKFKE